MSTRTLTIKPMQQQDLTAVHLIEKQCYAQPWTVKQFQQELDNPIAFVSLGWRGPELAGFICYWLIAGEMQVLNLATSTRFRRQGVADQLLKSAMSEGQQQGLQKVWLEVRRSNHAAISLYRRHGFDADAIRQNYYRDGEDALTMVCDFSTS